jgi:hypothetical protein
MDTNKPLAAHDLSKVLALVEVLAEDDVETINSLCEQWSVPFNAWHTMYEPRNYVAIPTIAQLARHALGMEGK